MGQDYYFGTDDDAMPQRIRQTRNAAKLCDACPVFKECLRHALEVREEYGVWAGTSGRTRRRLFTMLDNEEATVDQIIEVITHERRGAEPPRDIRRVPSGDRVCHEDAGARAL